MDETIHENVLRLLAVEGEKAPDRTRAIERLIQNEHGRVRGLAWRFGIPAEELDDAVQDIFVLAWRGRHTMRGDCAPSTWLTRIAINHLASRRRVLLRRVRFLRQVWRRDRMRSAYQRSPETAEAHERAMVCIQRLPRKLRLVFVLRYLEEMSCREVSRTLAIPEATVRSRAYHARRKLRGMMKEYNPWGP